MIANGTLAKKGGEEELSEALGEPEEGAGSHSLISVVSGCGCLLKH